MYIVNCAYEHKQTYMYTHIFANLHTPKYAFCNANFKFKDSRQLLVILY